MDAVPPRLSGEKNNSLHLASPRFSGFPFGPGTPGCELFWLDIARRMKFEQGLSLDLQKGIRGLRILEQGGYVELSYKNKAADGGG